MLCQISLSFSSGAVWIGTKVSQNECIWFWIYTDWALLLLHRYRRKCCSLTLTLSFSFSILLTQSETAFGSLLFPGYTSPPPPPLKNSHLSHFAPTLSSPLSLFWPPFLSILSNSIGWGGEVRVDPPTWVIAHAILAVLFSAGPQHPPAKSPQYNTNLVVSLDRHKVRDIKKCQYITAQTSLNHAYNS